MTLRKCIFDSRIILNGVFAKASHHCNYQQAFESQLRRLLHFNQNAPRALNAPVKESVMQRVSRNIAGNFIKDSIR